MPPSTIDAFIERYGRVSQANQTVLNRFIAVAKCLQSAGVQFLVLKGADVITRLYGVQGSRPISDIDLMVHETDLKAIDQVLTRMGFEPQIDGNPSYLSSELGLSLDLVTTLWYLDDRELCAVWFRAITRPFPPLNFACLATEDLLIHLTAYAVVHRGHVSAAFCQDIRLLIEKESPNWSTVVARAQHYHVAVPLHVGLTYASTRVPSLPIPAHVLSQLAPVRRRERVLAWFLRKIVTADPLPQVGHLLLLLTQPHGKKLQWLSRTFFPSAVFLSYRYGSRGLQCPWKTRLQRVCNLIISALVLMGPVLRHVTSCPGKRLA